MTADITIADIVPYAPLIQAGTTFVVGLAVAFIAWRQWQTAREKLALDLFDKRFAVFQTVSSYYGTVWTQDLYDDHPEALRDLEQAMVSSSFLFDKTIGESLNDASILEEGSLRRQILKDVYSRMGDYMRFDRPHRNVWRMHPRLKRILRLPGP